MISELCGASSVSNMPDKISNLVAELGIPLRLRDLGLDRINLDGIAQAAMLDNANKTNPRPMTEILYEALLDQAY
jgi:alcohol dehydrogenase class IV